MARIVTLISPLLAAGVLLAPGTGVADAIPPPPPKCPPGKVGTSSHGGPECVDPPPKSCPPGYRGVIRGRCVFAFCHVDASCEAGERCQDVTLCYHPSETWWEYRRHEPNPSNFHAAPPHKLDQPKTVWKAEGICQRDGDCQPPSECRGSRLCVPKGQTVASLPPPPPDAGATDPADPPPATSTGDAAATSSEDSSPTYTSPLPAPTGPVAPGPTTDPQPATGAERPGGCSKGCSSGAPAGLSLSALLLGVLFAARLARRRQRPTC